MLYETDFYRGKKVFVTGHTGFKGSWLCRMLINAGAIVTGYALPAPTEPSLFELAGIGGGMASVIGDIRDQKCLKAAFESAEPEIVFHLAAQPIVREAYRKPVDTYETNLMGTIHLLECVRTAQAPVRSVVIITTDKVYENREWVWGYRENEPLGGYDPYSSSKACAELAIQSYQRSFFQNSGTALSAVRAGNVIGGGDFSADRILPDCIRAVLAGKPVVVRNPYSVRPYQHVLEALSVYLMIGQWQYEERRFAGCYNVGPDERDCITTGELVELFCKSWDGGLSWEVRSEKSAPHEAGFLKLDCTKLKTTFGWQPKWDAAQAVEKTIEWNRVWLNDGHVLEEMDKQIMSYITAAESA